MFNQPIDRRSFTRAAGCMAGTVAASVLGAAPAKDGRKDGDGRRRGAQRLSLKRLKQFEALRYGMFISYDIQAFARPCLHAQKYLNEGHAALPPSTYAPDKLDVDQWISVARDAGMKYAVLTAKRHPGFCLWPSKHTTYTVANSGNKTDVVGEYVKACAKRGIQPGLYYPAVDIYHGFGIAPKDAWKYFTSRQQTFMTDQITELLTGYGRIPIVWIDIPRIMGRGYRTYVYEHIAKLQPEAVIMMNTGVQDGSLVEVEKRLPWIWPTDLISIETKLPPPPRYQPWRTVEGKEYYLPGEVCNSTMDTWYWGEASKLKPDEVLLTELLTCRERGVNYLLDAPPDNHGVVPQGTVDALMRLRRSAGI